MTDQVERRRRIEEITTRGREIVINYTGDHYPRGVAGEYRDKRIRVQAAPVDSGRFTGVWISIPDPNEQTGWATVFFQANYEKANKKSSMYRPGRWEKYLLKTVWPKSLEHSNDQRRYAPVNDSGLFPEDEFAV